MLAAWSKMKYPSVFDGTIAGSAPILMFTNDERESGRAAGVGSYWSVVTDDARPISGSQVNCVENVHYMFTIIKNWGSDNRRDLVEEAFNLCPG